MSLNIRASWEQVEPLSAQSPLRKRYLDGLPEAQDALLEMLVQGGRHHVMRVKGETVGYFVLHDADVLIEFYLLPSYEIFAHILLPQVVVELHLRAALIKTFDALFLSCALDLQQGVAMHGALVRDVELRPLPDIARIRYAQRTARLDDLPRILAVKQDVFTDLERLRFAIERGSLQLFERDDVLIGLGLMRPVIDGRPEVECGVAVDEAFRNKGYAVYMLRDLARHCFALGLRPISGSRRSNEASVRMGTRVGFLARHRILEVFFRVGDEP